MCEKCYDPTEHENHQVTVHVSTGQSGGVCDCGDPEAWTKPFKCKQEKHRSGSSQNLKIELPEDGRTTLIDTIRAVLDFVIDTFISGDMILQRFNTAKEIVLNEEGGIDELYSLLIWNDPVHTFDDVKGLVTSFVVNDSTFADSITNGVDKIGREVLVQSTDLSNLIRIKRKMETPVRDSVPGLRHTIRSTKNYIKEEIAGYVIKWLLSLPRDLVASALMEDFHKLRPSFDQEIRVSTSLEQDLSIPHFGIYPLIPYKNSERLITQNTNSGNNPYPFDEYKRYSFTKRLHYLLYFDVRLWKEVRLNLRDLYVSTLVTSMDHKVQFGKELNRMYPILVNHYLISDREPEYSALSSLTTQLFTAPSVSTEICENETIHFRVLFDVLTVSMVSPDTDGSITTAHIDEDTTRLFYIVNDLNFIITKSTVIEFDDRTIEQVCSVLLLFDGINKMTIRQGDHVEHELDDWQGPFKLLPMLLKMAFKMVSGGKPKLMSIWRTLVERIEKQRKIPHTPNDICFDFLRISPDSKLRYFFKFDPLRDEYSWFHPLHLMLAEVLKKLNPLLDEIDEAYKAVINYRVSSHDEVLESYRVLFLQTLFEPSIKTLSRIAQIQNNVWVRNGMLIEVQMFYYKTGTFQILGYLNDIFMAQCMLASMSPTNSMILLLKYFDLLSWPQTTLNSNMIEEFIKLLIILLSERTQLHGLSELENTKRYIRKEIIQLLGSHGPMPFSELSDSIAGDLADDELFEESLQALAIYKPPVGTRDSGVFVLKKQYYKEFDPNYISTISYTCYDGKDHDPILDDISSTVYKDIGAFTRTTYFAEFLYKVLHEIANGSCNEDIADYLLRLIHISALDDQYRNSDKSFLTIMCSKIDPDSEYSSPLLLLGSMYKLPSLCKLKDRMRKVFGILNEKDEVYFNEHFNGQFDFTAIEEENVDEKKGIAKRKKLQIIEKMQRKQKKFAKFNKIESPPKTSYEEESENEEQCIVCKMPCNDSAKYGILARDQVSNIKRFLGVDNIQEIFGSEPKNAYSTELIDSRVVITGCGHFIHKDCVDGNRGRCPLCDSRSGVFIPISPTEADTNEHSSGWYDPIMIQSLYEIELSTRDLSTLTKKYIIFGRAILECLKVSKIDLAKYPLIKAVIEGHAIEDYFRHDIVRTLKGLNVLLEGKEEVLNDIPEIYTCSKETKGLLAGQIPFNFSIPGFYNLLIKCTNFRLAAILILANNPQNSEESVDLTNLESILSFLGITSFEDLFLSTDFSLSPLSSKPAKSILHPGIPYLAPLPECLDNLYSYTAICLFCGSERGVRDCPKCDKTITDNIIFCPRDNNLYVIQDGFGTKFTGPYLDQFGEGTSNSRRKFLNKSRYQQFARKWYTHSY